MSENYNRILELSEKNPEEALMELSKIEERDKQMKMLQAEICQKLNKNIDALNIYIELLQDFGADKAIENKKLFLENIIQTSQLDIYACTNLHLDPWD